PDNINLPVVDLTQSGGTLESFSPAAAAAGVSLCLIDGELLSYTTTQLVGANQYQLAGLYRGQNGTAPVRHLAGAKFTRLDGLVLQWSYPITLVGVPLWFKFPAFNAFGGGLQSLAQCVAKQFTPSGFGVVTVPQVTNLGPGSGTYTTPANVAYLVVDGVGPGG